MTVKDLYDQVPATTQIVEYSLNEHVGADITSASAKGGSLWRLLASLYEGRGKELRIVLVASSEMAKLVMTTVSKPE